jgi:hypothetical protein
VPGQDCLGASGLNLRRARAGMGLGGADGLTLVLEERVRDDVARGALVDHLRHAWRK